MSGIEELIGEDGQLKPEVVSRAKALITNIATLCAEEEPAVVLFVLEAAMTEQIAMFTPPLGDLFRSMMKAYKHKAAVLIQMVEMLKAGGIGMEELMALGDEAETSETPQAEVPESGI